MNQACTLEKSNAATEMLILASDIAAHIGRVSEGFIGKFDKVMQSDCPRTEAVQAPTRQYPSYFDDLRTKLKSIQLQVEIIEDGIRRAEL